MTLAATATIDLAPVEAILERYRGQRGALIPVLQQAQALYGFLPREVLVAVANGMGVPLSQVYGVVTFYAQFYLARRGKHIIRQCDGTACHVRGSARLIDTLQSELGIKPGETTPDYQFTLEVVYCLGSCGLSPVAVVDDKVVGRLTPERVSALVRGLRDADAGASDR